MEHKLVIAEKPSVAISIAKVIGAKNKKDGYYEGKHFDSWTQIAKELGYGE